MREKGGGFEMEGLNPSTNYGLCNISKKNRVIKIMFCMMVSMKVFYKLIVLFLVFFIYLFIYFNWDSLHARLNSHYEAWSHKKKKHKNIRAHRKSVQKEPTVKRCLLILNLKPLRSQVKGNNSIGRQFQSLAVRGKKLLTQTSLKHLGMVTEKSCYLSE